jgi:hypothetical protein
MEQLANILQQIVDALQWVLNNTDKIVQTILAIIGAVSAIIKFLPTLKEGNPLLGLVKFLGKYVALNRSGEKDDAIRSDNG